MEKELLKAAQDGSVETLLKLLDQDQLILYRYVSGSFKETPLHIAAMFGRLDFTKTVLSHMPEMAKELDSRNSTPLHVATAHGHILVVKELLSANPDMCFAKDWEGKNPVHVAVIKGHFEILKELVRLRPQAAQALVGASTALHLCVKHYQLDALKYILEVIPNDAEFVNLKDEEGFTVLHLAVAEKQAEVVKFLLHQHHKVEVNAINAYGFTAFDIGLAHGRKNIKDIEVVECFQQATKSRARSTSHEIKFHSEDIIRKNLSTNVIADSNSNETRLISTMPSLASMSPLIDSYIEKTTPLKTKSKMRKQLEDGCNALMIVASLIATVTFQALINPPERFDEEENSNWSKAFKVFNTSSFSASIFVILLLISGLPMKCKPFVWTLRITMWIAVISAVLTYFCAMKKDAYLIPQSILNRGVDYPAMIVALVLGLLIIILMLGHAIRILFKIVRCFWRCIKPKRGRINSNAQDHQTSV